MQDTQSRTGENSQLPSSEQHSTFSHAGYPVHDRRKLLATFLWATFKFFHMQDTQSRTGENSFLLFSHAGYPVQDRRKLFFLLFSHAGYPVQDRRKYSATYLFHTSQPR
jgi:hypothetical protein